MVINILILQSQIMINSLLFYLKRFIEGISINDFIRLNCNKEDIVISQLAITRVDCSNYKRSLRKRFKAKI